MIAYLAIGLLIAAGLLLVLDWWAKAETAKAKQALMATALILTGIIAVFFITKGQWLLAAVPAFFTVNRLLGLGRLLSGLFGLRQRFDNNTRQQGGERRARHQTSLTHQEALDILGLEAGASDLEIQAAYKRVIASCHPDKGGSQWLAERVNAARDLLLKD